MRRTAAVMVIICGVLSAAPVFAQQQLTLTSGSGGNHSLPAMATNPDTGDVLAAWVTRDPANAASSAIWVRLIKRNAKGVYKAKKATRLVEGSRGKEAVAHRSPAIAWIPGVEQFYVVWQSAFEDGTSEIQGRVVKRKTGKPKGGVRVVASGGAVNTGAAVASTVLAAQTETIVSYVRRNVGGAAPFDFEFASQRIKSRTGTPSGEADVEDAVEGRFARVDAVSLDGTGAGVRGPFAARSIGGVSLKYRQLGVGTESPRCFIVLTSFEVAGLGVITEQLDIEEIPCGTISSERPAEIRVISVQDGVVRETTYSIGSILRIETSVRDLSLSDGVGSIAAIFVDPDSDLRTTGAASIGAPAEPFVVTRALGTVTFSAFDAKGRGEAVATFDYTGGIFGLVARGIGTRQGLEQAVAIWVGGPVGKEQVQANVVPLPQ